MTTYSGDTSFLIGAEVRAADGVVLGRLARVIVDPVAKALTHLVVEPAPADGDPARLVPVDLATVGDYSTDIRLDCDEQRFRRMEEAVEGWFIPDVGEEAYGYNRGLVSSWPFYGLGAPARTGVEDAPALMPTVARDGDRDHGRYVRYERVPSGEVDVHRGDPVRATDGAIGHVAGLVIDPADHHVTHVLLDEGHLWGRKQVAIPISAVSEVDGGIHLRISKDDVRDLPPVELHDAPA